MLSCEGYCEHNHLFTKSNYFINFLLSWLNVAVPNFSQWGTIRSKGLGLCAVVEIAQGILEVSRLALHIKKERKSWDFQLKKRSTENHQSSADDP